MFLNKNFISNFKKVLSLGKHVKYNFSQKIELLQTKIDKNSENFKVRINQKKIILIKERYASTTDHVNILHQRIIRNLSGGGKKSVEKHLERKKLLPRHRIDKIIDPG